MLKPLNPLLSIPSYLYHVLKELSSVSPITSVVMNPISIFQTLLSTNSIWPNEQLPPTYSILFLCLLHPTYTDYPTNFLVVSFKLLCKLISFCQPLHVMISPRFCLALISLLHILLGAIPFNPWLQLPIINQEDLYFVLQVDFFLYNPCGVPASPRYHSWSTTPSLGCLLSEYVSVYTCQ